MVDKPRPSDPDVIRACVARLIESGALGRGHVYPKLLSYLADRAIRGETPKEFDISVDVFGKAKTNDAAGDAQTRVHMHKLRARLDAYYAGAGRHDPHRLDIPKGTYHLFAVASERPSAVADARRSPMLRYAILGLLLTLGASLAANVALLATRTPHPERVVLGSDVWSGFAASDRPLLIAVGDHFFFGTRNPPVRMRDVRINSKEELQAAAEYAANPSLVFDALSYLPKSAVFALQTLLPNAAASGKTVGLKLVSELTAEDLRDHDIVYVGFVRAMAILRDYYFSKSNFIAEPPLFMSLKRKDGDVFARSGPVPQHNRDYGIVARFRGPSGNQILVLAGIGDVGVLSAVHSAGTAGGIEQVEAVLRSASVDPAAGFEVLVEADGHGRTDLGFRVIDAHALDAEPQQRSGAIATKHAGSAP